MSDPTGAGIAKGVRRFYGKYRGQVTENIDLLGLHRIKVSVPDVPSADDSWALPCMPYAGEGVGFYTVPPVGATVWVEFEGGNPNHPIWVGCFWDELEFLTPVEESPLDPPDAKILKTESCELILNDLEALGGIRLKVSDPAVEVPVTLEFSDTIPGAKLSTGLASITLQPEGIIIIRAGETTITLSEEGINMEGPAITGEAEADISFDAGGGMELNAGADVEIAAVGGVEVNAGVDLELAAVGAAELNAGVDLELAAGGAVELNAVGDVEIAAAGAMQLNAIGDIELASVTMVVTAIMDINGLVEVTGDLLIDGQQPLVV